MSKDSSYTFPFKTCETPNKKGIAQPYSAFLNLISSLIILYFLFQSKSNSSKLLLFSILLFELNHTFSHTIHLNNNIQVFITHLLAYLVNFCYFYALYKYSNAFPNYVFLLYLLMIILFDIYAFQNLPFVYYLFTQFLIFISLFVYYYSYFSRDIKDKIPFIFILTFLIFILFVNESYYCQEILRKYKGFPLHILIEITAILIVYNVGFIFSKL
jgi:hypothetical protein